MILKQKLKLKNLSSPTQKHEFSFYVSEKTQQIVVDIKTCKKIWIHVFVKYGNDSMGNCLITHAQDERRILIGKTPTTTSPTLKPSPNLNGVWTLICYITVLDVPIKIVPIEIELSEDNTIKKNQVSIIKSQPSIDKSGWVKGDFHTHTDYSDGKMGRWGNINMAKKQGLDFFFSTDHNILLEYWPEQEDILILPGYELTTNTGHCNFLGLRTPVVDSNSFEKLNNNKDISTIIEDNSNNGLLSLNHIYLHPWEWKIDIPLEYIDAIEIINDPTYEGNVDASNRTLELWNKLWNEGIKITGLGGSDSHLFPWEKYENSNIPSLIGDPITYVYVDKMTEKEILNGVSSGFTKISRIGDFDFSSPDIENLLPGMKLNNNIKNFQISLDNFTKKYIFQWIIDGKIVKEEKGISSQYEIPDINNEYHWLRVDIRNKNKELVGTFTPVYWNDKIIKIKNLKELGDEFK